MERIDEFRNALLVHISELNIEPMVKSLSLHPEELPDMYKPVSYTHLDVYKRQVYSFNNQTL